MLPRAIDNGLVSLLSEPLFSGMSSKGRTVVQPG
jgi:hypothetical protein